MTGESIRYVHSDEVGGTGGVKLKAYTYCLKEQCLSSKNIHGGESQEIVPFEYVYLMNDLNWIISFIYNLQIGHTFMTSIKIWLFSDPSPSMIPPSAPISLIFYIRKIRICDIYGQLLNCSIFFHKQVHFGNKKLYSSSFTYVKMKSG